MVKLRCERLGRFLESLDLGAGGGERRGLSSESDDILKAQ
jgi:hypothetical protein